MDDRFFETLRTLRERAGYKQAELAKKLGFAQPSSYTHYEQTDPEKPRAKGVSHKLVQGLVEALAERDVDARVLYELTNYSPPPGAEAPGLRDVEMVPFDPDREPLDPCTAALLALSASYRHAVPWRVHHSPLRLGGVLDGDLVLFDLDNVNARAGDLVLAQVYRGGLMDGATTVIRAYEPPYLVAASLDPTSRRPMRDDEAGVEIRGVAVAVLRDLRRR